jgi:membrane protease subunit HflC
MTNAALSPGWTTFSVAKPRTAVATHDLVEIIRVTNGRQPLRDPELEKSGTVLPSKLPDIQLGRGEIEKQITERTRQKIADFGIELLDERFKRSKYNPAVAERNYRGKQEEFIQPVPGTLQARAF